MRIILFICMLAAVPRLAWSAPAVNTHTGTVSQSNSIVIQGTGFGTKPTAAPLRYDSFESATLGQTMGQATGWWQDPSTGQPMLVTGDNPRTASSKSVKSTSEGNHLSNGAYTSSAYKQIVGFADTKKVYVNLWQYWNPGALPIGYVDTLGTPYWQIKQLRIQATTDSTLGPGHNDIYLTRQNYIDRNNGTNYKDGPSYWPHSSTNSSGLSVYMPVPDIGTTACNGSSPQTINGWYNISAEILMDSTPGANDGRLKMMVSYHPSCGVAYSTKTITTTPVAIIGATDDYFNSLVLQNYIGNVAAPPQYNSGKSGGYPIGYTVGYNGNWFVCTVANDPAVSPPNSGDNAYWQQTTTPYAIQLGLQYDNVYVDNSFARIELGDASTYDACTHREIQIPSAWSDTSITATVNTGTFSGGSTAYLYVIDSTGTPSVGYPVTIGTSSNPGVCGSANGQTVSTAPTTNLCTTGTASPVTGQYNWTCTADTVANCSASYSAPAPASKSNRLFGPRMTGGVNLR